MVKIQFSDVSDAVAVSMWLKSQGLVYSKEYRWSIIHESNAPDVAEFHVHDPRYEMLIALKFSGSVVES